MTTMLPEKNLITIRDNQNLIRDFISEMIIQPRQLAHKWAKITNQTPNLKTGYPSQHLASLIAGMSGTATGARGDDLIDKSEVKACSKVDQSDKCKECNSNVLRGDSTCPSCGSTNIKRNNDSKWLIGVRTTDELRMLLEETPRFIFLVTDYPYFENENFDDIRIRAFEIWVKSDRSKNFCELIKNYYKFLYLGHKEQDSNSNPAPKNLFPDSFPFYMCNPVKTFECMIEKSLTDTAYPEITYYVQPDEDRANLPSENMPARLLTRGEYNLLKSSIDTLKNQNERKQVMSQLQENIITENMRKLIKLRDTDKITKNIGRKTHK